MSDSETGGSERMEHKPCTCQPKVESAVYCPYCGGETCREDHRIDPEIPEVFCENTIMSTPRYCMGCGVPVDEYDWGPRPQGTGTEQ